VLTYEAQAKTATARIPNLYNTLGWERKAYQGPVPRKTPKGTGLRDPC